MKLNLNLPKIDNVDINKILLFMFAIEHQDQVPDMLDTLLDLNILNKEEDALLRIKLTTYDPNKESHSLSVPLYDNGKTNVFDEFIKKLVRVIPDNKRGLIDTSKETKAAFNNIISTIENLSLEELVMSCANYYQNEEFAKALKRYITENMVIEYEYELHKKN